MRSMHLPVNPPILPMLSKRIGELPAGGTWIFEPKWDGFRTVIFRDGDEILIQSRDEKSLNRYFPELLEPLRTQLPSRCVLDGEIVIAQNGGLDFEALQLRIHPAASRVRLLSEQCPASIVFFDLLCEGDRDLRSMPFQSRRQELETLLSSAAPPIHLTPATQQSSVAEDWFSRFEGAGLDGVMAKPISLAYESDKRLMLKIKHERDCDCVVAGFRWHKKGEGTLVGSLLLGLFDDSGALEHVGVCASFTQENRRQLVEHLGPIARTRSSTTLGSCGPSRGPQTAKPGIGCREARAAGARARICHGSRCAPSLWSKSLTSICRAPAFATWRSFEDGAPTRSRATALMLSSKSFRHRN